MQGKSLSGYQQKRVWLNDGAGHFADVAQAVGYTDTHDGRAVALVDLWNRGVLDVVVANQKRAAARLQEHGRARRTRWIGFDLRGTTSNRSAIGAEVRALLERPGAVAGGLRRQRLLGPEPAPPPLRPGQGPEGREGRHPLALRAGTDDRGPDAGAGPSGGGARDDDDRSRPRPTSPPPQASDRGGRFFTLDNRYLAAVPHHLHPARRPARLRLPGELLADAAGDRVQHRRWS